MQLGAEMNGAQVLVKMLQEYEVKVIFGVPGDTSIPLYDALYSVAPDIKHVMARDERSASFMADVYSRLTHKPGVCECPSGAGPLYSVPGVAEANASSIPIILLTSDIPLAGEGKQTITELNCQGLFESITKWSNLLKDIKKIPETIRRAFRIATTGRPGAVHLALPQEVLTEQYQEEDQNLYGEASCISYPAYRTRGSRKVIEELAEKLLKSKKPVIIAGGGTNHSQSGNEVRNLAEFLNAPVVTTISGQGIMPDEHPLALGVIGDNGFHPHAHKAIEEGDLLLYIGCKMGSVSTVNWTLPSHQLDRNIIQIDLDPELLANNYKNMLSIAGDAKLVIEDLILYLEGSAEQKNTPSPWLDELNKQRALFWKDSETLFKSDTSNIKPFQIISAINKRLTDPVIVIADAGTPTPYITRYLKLRGNDSRFIIPRSYGGLGYTIPALVGAFFARPDAQLVGLFGDGSLGMSAGELETLSRYNIPALLVHFNNASFGWIKALQAMHSEERFFSVDFNAGDPLKVAEGFGLAALSIKNLSELEDGLDEAFKSEQPFFLDIHTESEAIELPPVYSWQKASSKG